MSWAAVAILAAGAYGAKCVGFVAGHRIPRLARTERLLALLPVAVLAAVIVVLTFDGGRRLVIDARAAGVAVGTLAAWRRVPFVGVVVIAAATTAVLRGL